MNIAFFLTPKANVCHMLSTISIARGIDILRECGYTAVPVIDKSGAYIGVASEGDFLWHLLDAGGKKVETVGEIINKEKYRAVPITATMDELLDQALAQNFVPVVDDRGLFMGIVTRKDIIKNMIKTAHEAK